MRKRKQIVGVFVLIFLIMINFDVVQAIAPPRLDETNLGTLDTEQATITISNVYKEDQFSAYKILDIYRNTVTNEINYRYTDNFYKFLEAGGNNAKDYSTFTEEEYLKLTSGDITSGSTQTNSTLDVLVSDYASYIKKNKLSGIAMTTNGTTSSLTTNTGAYLVLPSRTDRIYAVMVGNLDYKEVNGEWVKQNSTIVAKASDPSIKTSIGKIGQTEASFTVGEEYTYFVEVKVPLFPTNATDEAIGITSLLGTGIELGNPEDVIIMNDSIKYKLRFLENSEAGDTTYYQMLSDSGKILGVLSIDSVNGEQTVLFFEFINTEIMSPNISIEFKAKLKDVVKICYSAPLSVEEIYQKGFPSNVMLSGIGVDHSYHIAGEMDPSLLNNQNLYNFVYAYTYKVQINKHVLGDSTKKLGGAVFEIYSDSGLTKKVGTVTTDDDGFAEFSGLGEGKYYLKEVTAPTGYSLLKLPTEIEIKYDESLIDSETGEYCGPVVDISNTKISALPITGGMGTIIFTLVGILLIGSAVLGITYYKKKNRSLV